ncbi:MAG: acetyl-CoA carboxylase carboxyltransferase subunit alpha [Planctomycetes bacterium]|nr:acetyl-CoA carboxylase carboxyltransferase subunit alpha [Planctomycetota bacterium]
MTNYNTTQYLPFEDEIASLDEHISRLKADNRSRAIDLSAEIRTLQAEQTALLQKTYSTLTPWQTVQVSRHPKRPLFTDYLSLMVKEPRQLHGDRCFGDDPAIMTILGQIGRQKVLIVGQNKGRDTKEKIKCNFGCPNPEGYRKAMAKMKLAEKFGLPVVTFIDTPGAYPGIGAEERGQAQAIAVNLMEMSRLKTPIISIVIGEGGSGGALGIGVGDRLSMLEYAYYSVISPEGCAGILWHDGAQAEKAAKALRLTSKELKSLGLIDTVIKEPLGGAHRSIHDTVYNVEQYIIRTLRELKRVKIDILLEKRYRKICAVGDSETMIRRLKSKKDLPAKPAIPERLSAKAQLEKTAQQEALEKAK